MSISSATAPHAYGSALATGGLAPAASNRTHREDTQAAAAQDTATGATGLTPQERRRVAELQQIDREVRAHEAAHMAAGRGVVTSGADYSYTYGPDGQRYAVAGEVGIDTAAEQKPEDNIEKGAAIQDAALAPRNPSAQDYRVAGIGAQLESRGRIELARARMEAQDDAPRRRVAEAYAASEPPAAPGLDTFA